MPQPKKEKNLTVLRSQVEFVSEPLSELGFPGGSDGKVSAQGWRPGFNPWVGKIPWRRKWQPTPVFLPGKFHRWRSLVGYSPWGHEELDMTERLHFKQEA